MMGRGFRVGREGRGSEGGQRRDREGGGGRGQNIKADMQIDLRF